MRILQHNEWRLLMHDNLSHERANTLYNKITAKDYNVRQELKDNHRSSVLRIELEGLDLVLKVPKEKNNRLWIRLLTWIRQGEAFKNLLGMKKLWDNGIKTTKPILAAEKRKNGMIVDSWLVYEYLSGQNCLDQTAHFPQVVSTLKKMHKSNLLHGDSQIRNFIYHKKEIYVIDSNPKSAWSAFERAYEWAYLRKSAPGIEQFFGEINNWWLYKLAYWYDIYDRKIARGRKRALKALRLR